MSKYRIEVDVDGYVKPFVVLHTDTFEIAERSFVALLPFYTGVRFLRDGSWERTHDRVLAQYDAPPSPFDNLTYEPVSAAGFSLDPTSVKVTVTDLVVDDAVDVAITDGSSDDW